VLAARGVPYIVVTLSPDGAREAEAEGLRVLRGNYARQHELTLAGAREASMLVIADDDIETTRRVVSAVRAINPGLRVLARTRFESEIEELHDVGAADVIAEEVEGIVALLTRVLESFGVDAQDIRKDQQTLRSDAHAGSDPSAAFRAAVDASASLIQLSEEQRNTKRCSHTGETTAVTPDAQGCSECIALGDRWVHLRICMTCGHVACCDSSKNKHATSHNRTTGHPIIRSFQPGEEWAWCYRDRRMF
jgi:CPA2 family monovalent cation:H+ antiporter-2